MNVVCIAGNITETPIVRTTQGGKKVTSFSVAVNEGKDKTEFFRCVAWEKTADLLAEYVKKGNRLSLTGRLSTSKYTDKDGVEKYKTEVIVSQFDFPPKNSVSGKDPDIGSSSDPADDMDSEIPF